MNVKWRKSAVQSLLKLDEWRKTINLSPIARYLKKNINNYFGKQNLSVYLPGRPVVIKKMPVDLRMVLISVGKSEPYKVFYRVANEDVEIFLIRHPRQKQL